MRHHGHCGRRTECWRSACRSTFAGYRTVEVLITGDVLAFCHRSETSAFDVRVDMWVEGRRS
jgi:hypothetical protein